MKRLGLILGLAVVTACGGDATGPKGPLIPDAIPAAQVYNPVDLEGTWRFMGRCSGLTGLFGFSEMTFYSVPRESFDWNGQSALGLFVPSRKEIYVANLHLKPTRTIRHEILHALLYPIDGHPPEWFGDGAPCGNLMAGGGLLH